MKYLVWSFDYYPDSAGQKVMHRLCHELNEAGQKAYVAYPLRNPDWNTPYQPRPFPSYKRDWMAVYPEIIKGNPWRAPRVVRYVLNHPGKLWDSDKTYPADEIVYCYSELFNDIGLPPERIMYLPAIELDIYQDHHLPREGEVYYVGKGQKSRDLPGAVEITDDLKRDQHLLAETLNRATLLHCFDNATAMVRIALLCGCPVRIIPSGEYTREQYQPYLGPGVGWDETPGPFDSGQIRAEDEAAYAAFRERLQDFIRVTQA
jgi:hypothetical protein